MYKIRAIVNLVGGNIKMSGDKVFYLDGQTPPSDAEIEAQQARDSAMAEETAARGEAREDTLESNVRRKRKGVGRRSLLRSSGGGRGFYSEYDI